jgi:hypothetical protein
MVYNPKYFKKEDADRSRPGWMWPRSIRSTRARSFGGTRGSLLAQIISIEVNKVGGRRLGLRLGSQRRVGGDVGRIIGE